MIIESLGCSVEFVRRTRLFLLLLFPLLGRCFSVGDVSQDWISNITAQGDDGCTLPPPPGNQTLPVCSSPLGLPPLTQAEYQTLGFLLAPRIHMHPQDWSFMADPRRWYNNATIYDTHYQVYTQADILALYASSPYEFTHVIGPELFATQIFGGALNGSLSTQDLRSNVQGDPIVNGTSQARMYFSVYNPDGATSGTVSPGVTASAGLVFVFHIFHPFSGCSNQLFATSMSNQQQGIEYYMCQTGNPDLHEGSWEHVSLFTCTSDLRNLLKLPDETQAKVAAGTIRRMQLSQHTWYPEFDCTHEECPSEVDPEGVLRTVIYTGLFSHALYREASALELYNIVGQGLLLGIQGLYYGDRTNHSGPVFQPTLDNVELILQPAVPYPATLDNSSAFSYFTGSWGINMLQDSNLSVTCFFNNFTSQAPCNATNPAWVVLDNVLGAYANNIQTNVSNLIWSCGLDRTAVASSLKLFGPLTRTYSYQWLPQKSAPLLSLPGNPVCPFSTNTSSPGGGGYDLTNPSGLLTFVERLVLVIILGSALFSLAMFFPRIASRDIETMPLLEPSLASFDPREVTPCETSLDGQSAPTEVLVSRDHEAQSPTMPVRTSTSELISLDSESTCSERLRRACIKMCTASWGCLRRCHYESDAPGTAAGRYRVLMSIARQVAWLLLAFAVYSAGIVLGTIGVRNVFQALNMLYRADVWLVLNNAFDDLVIVYTVFEAFVIVSVVVLKREVFAAIWMACLLGRARPRPFHGVDKCGYVSEGIICGFVMINLYISVVIFAVGVTVWAFRYVFQYGCNMAFSMLFDSFGTVMRQACTSLALLGHPNVIFCNAGLTQVCTVFEDLRIEYVAYGATLIILSHVMLVASLVNSHHTLGMEWELLRLGSTREAARGVAPGVPKEGLKDGLQ